MSECNCGTEDQQPNYKKAILEFNTATAEGEHDFEVAFSGQKLATLLYDFDQELRNLIKWGSLHNEGDNSGTYDVKFSDLRAPKEGEFGDASLRPDAANAIDAVRTLLHRMIADAGVSKLVEP